MGIDPSKLKLKKDGRDVTTKATNMFKKAAAGVSTSNKLAKVLGGGGDAA